MDFMKTLLLYMTLTFTAGVQSTSAPVITPTPAPTPEPTPTAIVTTVIPAEEMTEITPAPEKTEAPAATEAPGPALTPNKSYRTLNTKTSGAAVKKVQERLIELGYLKGNADGVYGAKTKKAVTEFQKYNGLSADGVAGKLTQTYLFEDPNVKAKPGTVTATPAPEADPNATPAPTAEPTPSPTPAITPSGNYRTLKLNARGAQVKKIQERLIELGYLKDNADGVYGSKTRNAVMAFQRNNGLKADGAAGKETQTWLFDHPDAKKADGTTVGPAATATPVVTEAPTEEPTAEPTEAPTATLAPTDTPVPEVTAEPEPETTEAPAEPEETTAPEETEAPEITEAPETTEEPEQPEETAAPEETEAPETAGEPDGPIETAEPEEEIESVELDDAAVELPLPLTGSVALNASGEPLSWLEVQDGANIRKTPRLWMGNGEIWISLDDLAASVDTWVLTEESGTLILEAEGYVIVFMEEDQGAVVLVDGTELTVKEGDLLFTMEGHPVKTDFLKEILNAEIEWDEEENTLLIQTTDKDADNPTD